MSKLIQKLRKKAERITAEEYTPGSGDYVREVNVKFAELLIRECAVVALNHHLHGLPETSADTAIKTHFGVES